jgi:hypothetical protein
MQIRVEQARLDVLLLLCHLSSIFIADPEIPLRSGFRDAPIPKIRA